MLYFLFVFAKSDNIISNNHIIADSTRNVVIGEICCFSIYTAAKSPPKNALRLLQRGPYLFLRTNLLVRF